MTGVSPLNFVMVRHGNAGSWARHAERLVLDKSYRRARGSFLVSGLKIVSEIAAAHPIQVAYCDEFRRKEPSFVPSVNDLRLPRHWIAKITKEPCPEGIVAELPMPEVALSASRCREADRVLVLFRIRDPGNLGTIVRTAVAFGWTEIVLVQDCVDAFNFKVVQASKGAIMNATLSVVSAVELVQLLDAQTFRVLIANSSQSSGSVSLFDKAICTRLSDRKRHALILGSEAEGVEGLPTSIARDGLSVTIPLSPRCESLNVATAAGVILSHLHFLTNFTE